MPPDLGPRPREFDGYASGYVDPVADLNAISAHIAPASPSIPEGRPFNPSGDPAAVQEITAAIEASGGEIPFSAYMDLALYGRGGYYSQGKVNFQSRDALGADGEFFTSPELSDDFSRAMNVGVCAIVGAMGVQPFNLVELGAGSGRMLKDVLATMRNERPATYRFATAYIADYGGMSARQRRTIGSNERAHAGSYAAMSTEAEHRQDLAKVNWIAGSALDLELDNGKPTIVIANEVPDAVCADVVRNNEGTLEQKFVAVKDNALVERWRPLTKQVLAYITKYGIAIEDGKEVAISTGVVDLHRRIGRLIRKGGIISADYGDWGPTYYQNTPWEHRPVELWFGEPVGDWYDKGAIRTYPPKFNPLQLPGDLDLTHDPDFSVMKRVIEEEGMTTVFYGTQRDILHRLGLPDVLTLETISKLPGLTESSIQRIRRAQELLGGSFKTLVATRGVGVDFSKNYPPLPGYREFF